MAHHLPGILIVDDQAHMLRLLEYNLRSLGARLHFAGSAEQGLEIARREGDSLRLAVLDYELPGLNGIQLFSQFKQLPSLDMLRVIMLTAQGQGAIRTEAESLGVNAFLTKPFSPRELLRLANDLLEENVHVS